MFTKSDDKEKEEKRKKKSLYVFVKIRPFPFLAYENVNLSKIFVTFTTFVLQKLLLLYWAYEYKPVFKT